MINQNFNLYADTKNNTFQREINSAKNTYKEFNPTTKIKGSLFFTLGALDSQNSNEATHFTFENKIRIDTSFRETDRLLTVIESGNAYKSPLELDLQSKKGDELKISTLFYEFKIREDMEAIIGPKMFGYNGLAGKSTAYNERIGILDGSNYTTSAGIGPGVGLSLNKRNGLNASIKFASKTNEIKSSSSHFLSQIGMTGTIFGGTITGNLNEEFNAIGLAGYFKPQEFFSISASIEKKETNNSKSINNWIIGLQRNLKNYKIGFAAGTYNEKENMGFEGWSEIAITDNFKFIPVLFIREKDNANSDKGIALNTKFIY